jgi:hypothetical protein
LAAPKTLTPAERSARARTASHASWKRTTDRRARTRPAFEARLAKFADELDPNHTLDPVERRQRAESALKESMARLSFESLKSRRLAREAAQRGTTTNANATTS